MEALKDIEKAAIIHLDMDNPYVGNENNMQIACASWLRLQFPKALAFHVPNGGRRPRTSVRRKGQIVSIPLEASKFKKMGVLAGVPDFIILEPNETYSGLIIELKTKGGTLQKTQKEFLIKCIDRGYKTIVCWSTSAFEHAVCWYFNKSPT